MNDEDKESYEVYNFKDNDCQSEFRKFTSKTKILSDPISDEGDLNENVEGFMKKQN